MFQQREADGLVGGQARKQERPAAELGALRAERRRSGQDGRDSGDRSQGQRGQEKPAGDPEHK